MLLTAEINGSLSNAVHSNGTEADATTFVIPKSTTLVMVCIKGADGYATHDSANADPSASEGTLCPNGKSLPFFDGLANFAIGSSGSITYCLRCYKG
jgi:hypothetical protein